MAAPLDRAWATDPATSTTRINPTGHTVIMTVPLKDGTAELGDITIKLTAEDRVLLSKGALIEKLGPLVTSGTTAKLQSLPESGGFLAIGDIKSVGLDLNFDPGLLEVTFTPTVEQRPVTELSMGRPAYNTPVASVAPPAAVSGFLNVVSGVDYVWGGAPGGQNGFGGIRFDFAGALRFWGLVAESEMAYETSGDTDGDLYGQPIYLDDTEGLKRRRSRLVYDLPEYLIRIQAGDADTLATGFQNANSVLGLSIEKSPRKLAPNENIRPTGRGSFRVDRPAEVDVVINGAIMQHLQLRQGAYNLSELPLGTGANEVELIITDDTGQQRSLKFTTYFDDKLLAPGKSEWAVTGGVPSYVSNDQVSYLNGEWFGSGFYRQGLTEAVTGELYLQGDGTVAMGGAGAVFRSPIGVFGLDAAASNTSGYGVGYAASLGWDLVNFRGLIGEESLHVSAEYRSPGFANAGELASFAEINAYDPTYFSYLNPYWLRLTSGYTFPIAATISGSFAARYQFADDNLQLPAISTYGVIGDRYGADFTVSVPVAGSASMSLTAGYSNEAYNFSGDLPVNSDGEFRAAVRFFIRPDDETSVAASYDTLNSQSNASATRIKGQGVDRWETSVNVQHDNADESAGGNAAIAYYGNRYEARVAQSTGFNGISYDLFNVQPADERTSVRIGTALVFAGGHVGLGAPIRSNGFAIVTPHESIAGKEVSVGTPDDVRARSDALGPAVITDVPAYTPVVLPVDVADLPIGYSLGSGSFDVVAPYRAGYALEVGSSYSVSAFGTLVDADGSPLALLTGVARPADGSGKTVEVFTNAAGRFGAEGLAPGRWLIEMATEPVPTRYVIEIPEGTEGLFRAGEVKPASGGGT